MVATLLKSLREVSQCIVMNTAPEPPPQLVHCIARSVRHRPLRSGELPLIIPCPPRLLTSPLTHSHPREIWSPPTQHWTAGCHRPPYEPPNSTGPPLKPTLPCTSAPLHRVLFGHRTLESPAIGPRRQTYALTQSCIVCCLDKGGGGAFPSHTQTQGCPPPCDSPSGCCSFTGPWTVTRSSLRMLRRVAAFCRPLRPVLLLVSFPRSRSPVVGVLGLC